MIWVLAFAAVAGVIGGQLMAFHLWRAQLRGFERRERAWELERRQLLDRLMHLAGSTWAPPPTPPDDSYVEPEVYLADLEPVD